MMAPSAPTDFECASDVTGAPDWVVETAVIVLLFLFFLRGTMGRKLLGLLALLADALVHDVGDLDGHRLGVRIPVRREAGRVADGAVHVFHAPATYANGVVVVVAHPRFVERGGVRRLEP